MSARSPLGSNVPGVTAELLDRTFEPYVLETLDRDDPRWRERVARIEETPPGPSRVRSKGMTSEGERTTAGVASHYDELWSAISLDEALHGPHTSWFEWRHRGVQARTIGLKRVFQLYLMRVLEWLRPASVTEVGFGWGLNLLTLSVQCPDVRFGGVELTDAGVRTARALAADARTPDLLREFVVDEVRDVSALQRLDLRQGSAEALPLADRSVDMVITVLALEQMNRIRESALREIARVARRHVVMIEPFRDWNEDGHRREHIRRNDYWSAAIDDLPAFGLTPIVATADVPQKLKFHTGIVVAEVSGGR